MKIFKESGSTCHQSNGNKDNSTHVTQTKMKLKRTRKERTCHECKKTILKGQLYGQKTKTISDPQGQSLNGGRTWSAFQMSLKMDLCPRCGS